MSCVPTRSVGTSREVRDFLAFDVVLFDFSVEGGAADAEEFGGFGDVVAGAVEGFGDEAHPALHSWHPICEIQ